MQVYSPYEGHSNVPTGGQKIDDIILPWVSLVDGMVVRKKLEPSSIREYIGGRLQHFGYGLSEKFRLKLEDFIMSGITLVICSKVQAEKNDLVDAPGVFNKLMSGDPNISPVLEENMPKRTVLEHHNLFFEYYNFIDENGFIMCTIAKILGVYSYDLAVTEYNLDKLVKVDRMPWPSELIELGKLRQIKEFLRQQGAPEST